MSSLSSSAKVLGRVYFSGLRSGLRVHRTIFSLVASRTTQVRVAKCLTLNGVIFVGSIVTLHYVLLPLLHWVAHFMESTVESDVPWENVTSVVERIAVGTFTILWLIPSYAISFILNTVWYQEIAEQVYKQEHGEVHTSSNAAALIRDELYRLLLFAWFSLQTVAICYIVPFVGWPLSVAMTAWSFAFYCFDYKWVLQGWELERRLRTFEKNWVWMLGFGTPCASICAMLPTFLGYGVYALLFPVCMVLAILSTPLELPAHTNRWLPQRIPIFVLAQHGNLFVLRRLGPPPSKTVASKRTK